QTDGMLHNASFPASSAVAPVSASPLSGPMPLVKIRFDRADIAYEEPVYTAVNEALQRYPNAQFDIIAIHHSQGNAAEVAIESTSARRKTEKVLTTMTQTGLDPARFSMSYDQNNANVTKEFQLYIH